MADFGGFSFATPQELLAQAAARRQKVMIEGNVRQQRNQNMETALDTLFGNPALRNAQALQERVAAAEGMIQPVEGEDDLSREMRRLVAIRDNVADISPETASQVNAQLLKLGQARLEQQKLRAEMERTQAEEARDAALHPLNIQAREQEIAAQAAEGQNYWREVGGKIERQNVSALDSIARRQLRMEGWIEGTGPGTEAEATSALGLAKPVVADLQTSLVSSQNMLDGLAATIEKYDPAFSTLPSQFLNGGVVNWVDRLGLGKAVPPERREVAARYVEWRTNARDGLNRYIQSITGAAMSNQEAGRIRGAYPNEDDGYTAYLNKMRAVVRQVLGVQKRAQQFITSAQPPRGDQWDAVATPPVSDAEVDAFMGRFMGVGTPPSAAPAGGSVVERFRTKK